MDLGPKFEGDFFIEGKLEIKLKNHDLAFLKQNFENQSRYFANTVKVLIETKKYKHCSQLFLRFALIY